MKLLESDKIKIKVLFALNRADKELTMNSLRNHVGLVNYNSLVRNCEFLELINFINIDTKIVEDRKYFFVSITKSGKKHLELIRCKNEAKCDKIIGEI